MVYLIKYTTPAIFPGICHGQSDINVALIFTKVAGCIVAKVSF